MADDTNDKGPMVTPREGSRLLPREGNSRTNSKRISSRPTSREAKGTLSPGSFSPVRKSMLTVPHLSPPPSRDGRNEKEKADYLKRGVTRMAHHQSSDVTLRSERDELVDRITAAGNGSLMRGWRTTLDPEGELQVDYDDFCRVTGSWKWVGDINALFGGDGDLDHLQLSEIAPKEGKLMTNFMKWIKEEFGSPAGFFCALDANKKGKVARHSFVSFCVNRSFKAAESDINRVFDCIDTGDIGFILKEDCIFLEVDPAIRYEERQRGGVVKEWKDRAAMEFLQHAKTGIRGLPGDSSSALPDRHRLAPRPWQAGAFEQIPMVVCQRRQEREREARFKQKFARATFLRQLRTAYGNEVRGLRRDVTPDGYMATLSDIRRYCRQVDLPVQISDLWASLDTDGDGRVRMEELCSHRAEALAKFKDWTSRRFGRAVGIWDSQEALRARARRRAQGSWVSESKMLASSFGEALRELGWPGVQNAEERSFVFTSLDSMGCNLITLQDLEWLDRWQPSEFLAADPNPSAWVELKELLVKTYSHPLRAWRILDRDSSNRIAWTEFRDVCKKVRYTGDCVGAWRALDTDMSGYISMREYDPESEELLTSFKEWADSHFGSVRHCFKALDSDRSGSVTFPELKRACHKMKWTGNVRTLFDCLDIDSADRRNRDAATGKRAISLEEIAFLDSWNVDPRIEVAEIEDALAEAEAKRVLMVSLSLPAKLVHVVNIAGVMEVDGDSKKAVLALSGEQKVGRTKSGPLPVSLNDSGELPVMKRRNSAPQRPHSQGNQRKRGEKNRGLDARKSPKHRKEVECRPCTENSWLRSFTSFQAVEARR